MLSWARAKLARARVDVSSGLSRGLIVGLCALMASSACSVNAASIDGNASDAAGPADADQHDVAASIDAAGVVDDGAPSADAGADTPAFAPDQACEYSFFSSYFDRSLSTGGNGPAFASMRDETFRYVAAQVAKLHDCGAGVTLGGMLSLMIFEGGGAKVAFFNDRCSENAYDASATCFDDPKARYSYQYGLAPVHTSNFHPCADVTYTSKMRTRLAQAIADAGFAPSPTQIAGVASDLHTFCPSATPTAVDYYILTAHSAFGVPKNGSGNDLGNAGSFPFFTPRVVIDLFFGEIGGACAKLASDADAIAVFGGGDASYATTKKQSEILALYGAYKSSSCP